METLFAIIFVESWFLCLLVSVPIKFDKEYAKKWRIKSYTGLMMFWVATIIPVVNTLMLLYTTYLYVKEHIGKPLD